MVQAVLEAEREANDQYRIPDSDRLQSLRQMLRRKCPIDRIPRQCLAPDLDCRHIDVAGGIEAGVPSAQAAVEQRNRKARRHGQSLFADMQLDFDSIRIVRANGIAEHVAAGDEKQLGPALEEEPRRIGQVLIPLKRLDSDRGQEDRFDVHAPGPE